MMIHLNEEIRTGFYKFPSWQKIGLLFIPEIYIPTTIDDFVRNAENIKLTRKIFPPGYFFNDKAVIIFNNVAYRRTGKEWCEIEDMNNALEAKILMPDSEINEIYDGARLDSAYIAFSPKSKKSLLWFINYSVFENSAADRDKYLIPAYAGA